MVAVREEARGDETEKGRRAHVLVRAPEREDRSSRHTHRVSGGARHQVDGDGVGARDAVQVDAAARTETTTGMRRRRRAVQRMVQHGRVREKSRIHVSQVSVVVSSHRVRALSADLRERVV